MCENNRKLKELQIEIPKECIKETRKKIQDLSKNAKKRLAYANIPL
jgi:hypothetical protein